jgi:hypothetical protein
VSDFWQGFLLGGVAFLVVFIGWFLCTFNVDWDFSGDGD